MKEQLGLEKTDESKLGVRGLGPIFVLQLAGNHQHLHDALAAGPAHLRADLHYHPVPTVFRYVLYSHVLHRNELYNAQGAMTDEPRRLDFICAGGCGPDWGGALFAELEVCILHLIIVTVSFPAGPVW